MKWNRKRGISLIVLVITIIVVIILAAVVILTMFKQGGILDSAKRAKFMSDFRGVEEGVNIFSISKIDTSNPTSYKLPVENKLTLQDKQNIVSKVPTLEMKINELNPGKSLNDLDLYWINENEIGISKLSEGKEKGYIIDAQTNQVYDYTGDFFEGKRWHTLDSGVEEVKQVSEEVQEMWNGWIKLTLYYPSSSTNRQWRLGSDGELRADPMLMWQNYTGSITIPLDRMKDVWIKYNLNGKDVTIPPAGKLLVDIIPDKTGTTKVDKVNVTINYDPDAIIKEYRINDSGWLTYTDPFTVTENCIIEARAKKIENVYNTDGSILLTRDIVGSDMVHIGNIGIEEKVQTNEQLPAPTIERLSPQNGSEKARVKITYPAQASAKKYTQNYGSEQDYANEISINEFGTVIVAYYYDASGNKSSSTLIYINDTSSGAQPEAPELVKELAAPIIERLAAQSSDEKARIKITYPSNANSKIYTKDHGAEEVYSDEISIKEWGTTVIAYYYDTTGSKSNIAEIYINDTSKGEQPEKPKIEDPKIPQITPAPIIKRLDPLNEIEKARVQIVYPEQAVRKVYKINYGPEQEYGDFISVRIWGTNIIAYYYDKYGNMSEITSITINDTTTGEQSQTPENYDPVPQNIPDTVTPPTVMNTDENLVEPTITRLVAQDASEKARVHVEYPIKAIRKIYTVNDGAEIEYIGDIKIYGWGTKIIAYYYDENGNKSKQSQILINEDPTLAEETKVFKPESLVAAPDINLSPSTGIVNQVTVTVTSSVSVDKIYLKLGKYAEFKEYTGPVVVKENMEVYAYYKAATGETSLTSNKIIGNIKVGNKPYLKINANPYPCPESKGANNVNITLSYSDADKIEYSEDGIIYSLYIAQFQVTENKRIYARATNSYGVTESYLDITNIGAGETGAQIDTNTQTDTKTNVHETGVSTVPEPIKKLGVSINAEPDPTLTQTRVAKVKVSIEYDQNATDKLYSIGKYGDVKQYTGSFDVITNCTIYAYAKAENALGEATKVIDNILDGIADPVITTEPMASVTASKVSVSIAYDKYATVKKYSINGGALQDYTGSFDVTENETKIYAYSENAAGQKSSSNYTIQNIVPLPPVLMLDKGSYYILKLNYPEGSKGREYKWKEIGDWGTYKEDGILLIKPQFKDQVIRDGTLIKIEDENGNKIDFKGDYYFIDVPFCEVFENIFMRWDRTTPKAPQIFINPTESTKQVTATIIYQEGLIKKQYRLLYPGDILGQWRDYTGPITIDKNNTIIYAKGMDEAEVWSQEGMYKVTNIDETPPVINIVADLSNPKKEVPITVKVTDDSDIVKIKWIAGMQGESYFRTEGTEIANNSVLNITDNGYYTFYSEDIFGNIQVYTLNITNIDKTSPDNPVITSTPISWTNGNVTVTIAYSEDTAVREYSLDGINWNVYLVPLTISANNTTAYARSTDEVGNQSGQSTLTIANIERYTPTVSFGTNSGTGGSASTTVTVSDAESGVNESTLQYVWDIQNTTTPTSGWTTFTNGATLTKTGEGTYYLWVKAIDNAGNSIIVKSNQFIVGAFIEIVSTIQTENKTFAGATTGFTYNNPVIPTGFVAVNTNDANWDNLFTDWDKGLVIQDVSGNQFVWVPVDGTNVPYAKWCTTGFSYSNTSDDTTPAGFNVTNITTKYKGFYIARYEAMFDYNGGSKRAASKKSTKKQLSPDWSMWRDNSYTGYLWNYVNYTDSKTYAENMDTSYEYDLAKVGTNLITGAEWDTTMKWIQNSGKSVTDSRAWGNYFDSISPANTLGYANLQISGYSNYWRTKNIYDLAGNTWEFTNEKNSYSGYTIRGGSYGNNGSTNSAAYRHYNSGVNSGITFRVALYIL